MSSSNKTEVEKNTNKTIQSEKTSKHIKHHKGQQKRTFEWRKSKKDDISSPVLIDGPVWRDGWDTGWDWSAWRDPACESSPKSLSAGKSEQRMFHEKKKKKIWTFMNSTVYIDVSSRNTTKIIFFIPCPCQKRTLALQLHAPYLRYTPHSSSIWLPVFGQLPYMM